MKFLEEKRYIKKLLKKYYDGGKVLEIAAGRAVYNEIFDDYTATDLPNHPYKDGNKLDAFCDARYLPFPPNTFNYVFIVAALHLIPKPEVVIKNLNFVLKPGGRLLIFDYTIITLEKNCEKTQ